MKEICKDHVFLRTYLDYVEETESPRLFHVWSALSGVSASLGRRAWFPFGHTQIFPNMYIALVGPSGARKSAALKIVKRLLRQATGVRFAPDDTGGQRQGILAAMTALDVKENDDGKIDEVLVGLLEDPQAGLEKLGSLQMDGRDPHCMYVCQEELNSFLGEQSTGMMTFLIKMFDGDDYDYTLKKETLVLKEALLSILGGTTPTQIALSLPAEAVGQGFSSRVIFVYAGQKYKSIARPRQLNGELGNRLLDVYSHAYHNMAGPFQETPEAAACLDAFYETKPNVNDPRFVGYANRRHEQLIKVIMACAASEKRQTIVEKDVVFADALLRLTEKDMPDALGEYGMSKTSAAKQKLIEFIRSSYDPLSMSVIYMHMSRDMTRMECHNALTDFHNAGQVKKIQIRGETVVISTEMDSLKKKANVLDLL